MKLELTADCRGPEATRVILVEEEFSELVVELAEIDRNCGAGCSCRLESIL